MGPPPDISSVEVSWPEIASVDGRPVMLLRPVGEIGPDVDAALKAAVREADAGTNVVVDMGAVTSMSMAGAVDGLSALLVGDGRRLVLAACPPIVAEAVGALTTPVRIASAVSEALSPPAPETRHARDDGVPDRDGLAPRAELFRLRQEARTSPLSARAQGMLTERYRLTGAEAAFGLLRSVCQEYRVSVRSLASAFIAAPRPSSRGPWFPGRRRTPPPTIFFDGSIDAEHTTVDALLESVLESGMTCTDTTMGTVQIFDSVLKGLVLENQRGFSPDFVDFFVVVDDSTTSCAAARCRGARVTVDDVATDAVFDDVARHVILSAGARSTQSTPMLDALGHCIGMYSTHDAQPARVYSQAQTNALDTIAAQAGVWLDWHQQTVILDALEALHKRATQS